MFNKNEDLGFLLKRLSEALRQNFNRELQKYDLTISQIHVLGYLSWHRDRPVTQKEIEDYLQVSHPTTVGILKRLEEKEMITTTMNTRGRLSKTVTETEKAKKLDVILKKGHSESEKRLKQGFTDTELAQLMQYLGRMTKNMNVEMFDCMEGGVKLHGHKNTQKAD